MGEKRMRKRWLQSALAIVLAVTMCLGLAPLGGIGGVFKAEEADVEWVDSGLVVNGDFEDGQTPWSIVLSPEENVKWAPGYKFEAVTGTDGNALSIYKNESDSKGELAISVSQSVTLPAGTYKLGISSTGKAGDAKLVASVGELGQIALVNSTWGTWDSAETEEFTINEETKVNVTVSGTMQAGCDGIALDNIVLYQQKQTAAWVDSGLVVNGDFEDGQTPWSIVLSPEENVKWAPGYKFEAVTGTDGNALSIYKNESDSKGELAISVSQSVTLPAGTYKLGISSTGKAGDAKLVASVGELGQIALVNSTWGTWDSAETEEFTISGETKVNVTVSGTMQADCDGIALDNIILYRQEQTTGGEQEPEEKAEYKVTVTPSATTVETGDTVTFTAAVTKNGEPVEDLSKENLSLWMYEVDWIPETPTPGDSGIKEIVEKTNGKSLTVATALESVGTYHFEAKLEDSKQNSLDTTQFDVTVTEPKSQIAGDINVKKISNLREDFIMGMDISSIISEFDSGVVYKDYEGNIIDNVTDFCKFVASQGITHIRVRVWNDPYDSNGNGYGGGNNDVAKAKEIADGCRAAGIKMLVDFHCSDLWTDPGKQFAPKAWQNYTLDQKKAALKEFIQTSLETIDPKHDTVAMVQVGNETTSGFIGEKDVKNMCALFQSGSEGVKAYNQDVQVVIHVTNPESGNVTRWAKNLSDNKVDYDILATSYYPYWHGTLENLASEFEKVQSTYHKDVMVAETSYAYTLEDSDGHTNTVRVGNNDTGGYITEPFSEQGQATAIRNLMNTVNAAGGLGVFYWEPAWITVGNVKGLTGYAYADQVAENKAAWEKYGSGWASSYAGSYDPDDAGQWYGGSAVDNEAFFYPDGTPTVALHVWNYVKTGAVSKYTTVESIGSASQTINIDEKYELPDKIAVNYDKETVEDPVEWNKDDIAKIDTKTPGTYVVKGTVTFSKTVDNGKYKGEKTGETTYTLVVKAKNWIEDTDAASFKKNDCFKLSGTGIQVLRTSKDANKADDHDPYDDAGCVHWYSKTATTSTVTYEEPIALKAGEYTFEAITQGEVGDVVYLQVLDTNDNVLYTGEKVTLADWHNWKQPFVQFTLGQDTQIKLRLVVEINAEGWGSADLLYLHETVAKQPEQEAGGSGTDDPAEESKPEAAIDVEEGAPSVSLPDTVVKDLQDAHIIDDGESVILHVESKDEQDIPEQEMKEVTAVLQESGFDQIGAFIDLNLYKVDQNNDFTKLENLTKAIAVTIVVPESLRQFDSNVTRTFAIVRLHDGEATLIDADAYDPQTGELKFSTDAFSTYAIVYKDEEAAGGNPQTPQNPQNPQTPPNPTPSTSDKQEAAGGADTGDHSPIIPFAVLLIAAAGVVGVTAVRRRKAK